MSPALVNPRASHNLMEMVKYKRHTNTYGNGVDLLDARDVVHVDKIEHACLIP